MKILLFGESGQVGFELAKILPIDGHQVICVNSSEGNFLNPNKVIELIYYYNPNIVINAVAFTKVDLAESKENEANVNQINALTPGLIAKAVKKIGAILIHYSTDYIFDGNFNFPISEKTLPNPINKYGVSKLNGEKLIIESGCKYLIFRISWVYASRGHNFYLTMLKLFKEKEVLSIVNDQIGVPTSARWVANMTSHSIKDPLLQAKLGIYNLSPDGETSWYGFANSIFTKFSKEKNDFVIKKLIPINSSDYPMQAKRPLYSKLDSRKFATIFNVRLSSWDRILSDVIKEL